MPVLNKIVIQDFRNIELQELEFSPNVNCISGGNGEGKTNLLDAIWYLSMTKSAFSSSDQFVHRYGAKAFALSGLYGMQGGTSTRISIKSDGTDKKIRRDDKAYSRASEHIGLLPIVMISPADVALVSESGEERRKFVNSVISQIDRGYLEAAQQYKRMLMQRNRLLKDTLPDEDLLCSFDEALSRLANPIYERRKKFARDLAPIVSQYYDVISGGREQVDIEYRSEMDKAPLEELLLQRRAQDLAMHFTTAGVQRDDFVFKMNGHPIRRCGSQGQQKSFLVAVKFAQYELMKQVSGISPILLLDDLFDKLDMGRVENLLGMVAGADFGQIFITDSNKLRINGIVDALTSDRAFYEAKGGVFSKL